MKATVLNQNEAAPSGERPGWNVVLSFGDLSHQTGYRTRVLGELQNLDSAAGHDPFLLLFDRHPERFQWSDSTNHLAIPRGEFARFFLEINTIARRQPIAVIHAHNLYSAALALAARRFFGYRVVLDYHGRIPEEFVFLGKGGDKARTALELLEAWVVRSADHVIVVSRALGRYLVERYRIHAGRLSVIPCCADARTFRFDAGLRQATRETYDFTERLVCTHLGSFFEWYESEMLVKAFLGIHERYPMAHLLAVTPGAEAARSFLQGHLPAGAFTVLSASHAEVPALLNASDLGFLLLRSSPNIKTSSPAKFAEYLNCGLPVIMTAGVGDFSSLVRNKHLGEVIGEPVVADRIIRSVLHSRVAMAQRCVDGGRELTWQFHQTTAKHVF